MDREDNYDIPTPDTSRSNSINENEEEDNSTEPTAAVPVEDTTQAESSRSHDQSTDVAQSARPAKRATFVPSSSSSESETDFVAVERNDVDDDTSAIANPNESSLTTEVQANDDALQTKDSTETKNEDTSDEPTTKDENNDNLKFDDQENVFDDKSRFSQFEAFASDQPLKTLGIGSIVAEIDNEFNDSSQMQESTTSIDRQSEMLTSIDVGRNDNEPWELDDSGEERITPVQTTSTIEKNNSYNNFFSEQPSSAIAAASALPATTEGSDDETEEENYDDYFNRNQVKEENEVPSNKTVRFDEEHIENVTVLTPKDSLEESETPQTPPDSDDDDDIDEEDIAVNLRMTSDRIMDHMNDNNIRYEERPAEVIVNKTVLRPESEISLADSEDLPPPLPPLPPLNKKSGSSTDNIPSKSSSLSSTSVDLKRTTNSRIEAEPTATIQTTTEAKLHNNPDPQVARSFDSAILRSVSRDNANTDSDEVNDVISCVIDNNQITIDAKTISPFKCVIESAGQLQEDSQTAVIAIYGCWLPDRRLREYRYIMDQLFYYVYHQLDKLVTNDYILVYFHGATPKHRTPDFKILRKYYQMLNFRLRKNLRAVYVVHPTRWLRTLIAFSRPFFSNKFYHKVNYLFTIAELERQFPHNHIELPVIIEQHDTSVTYADFF